MAKADQLCKCASCRRAGPKVRKFCKQEAARLARRAAKIDPEDAPRGLRERVAGRVG